MKYAVMMKPFAAKESAVFTTNNKKQAMKFISRQKRLFPSIFTPNDARITEYWIVSHKLPNISVYY